MILMLKFELTSSSCHCSFSGSFNSNTNHEINDVKTAGYQLKKGDNVFATEKPKVCLNEHTLAGNELQYISYHLRGTY